MSRVKEKPRRERPRVRLRRPPYQVEYYLQLLRYRP
jgi:hypothetical protein